MPVPAGTAKALSSPQPLHVPAAHKHKKQDVLQPCDTAYPVFVHQTAVQEANGIIECGACQKCAGISGGRGQGSPLPQRGTHRPGWGNMQYGGGGGAVRADLGRRVSVLQKPVPRGTRMYPVNDQDARLLWLCAWLPRGGHWPPTHTRLCLVLTPGGLVKVVSC